MARSLSALCLLFFLVGTAGAQVPMRLEGSSALVLPFSNASALLLQHGIDLKITGTSNSPRAIAAVGWGQSEFGISTRPVTPEERSNYPDRPMVETILGYQALALIVSNDVWEAGVRSLSKAELQQIYESKVTNWKSLGGPNRDLKFFNPEKGKGIWEFYAAWLYGEAQKAPSASSFETVATSEETRNVIEFNNGSLSVIPPNRADSKGTHALAVRREDGTLIAPTSRAIRSQVYPIMRPVIVVTGFRLAGAFKKTLDVMQSGPGQGFIQSADIVPLTEPESE